MNILVSSDGKIDTLYPAGEFWVHGDGRIAGKIGRKLQRYKIVAMRLNNGRIIVYDKEKLKDVATGLKGVAALLGQIREKALVETGKDYHLQDAIDNVYSSLSDVVVDIEGRG